MTFDLSPYDHVALDMNGTFLFGYDRFGPGEDFGATYRRLGFTRLDPALAHRRVREAYDYLAPRYVDPEHYADFPSVAAALAATSPEPLPRADVDALVATFAEHELGALPPPHGEAIAHLRTLRPLSLVSNLWAPKGLWLRALERWGVGAHLEALTFSSDGPFIKPHPTLFADHLARLGLPPKRVLYVGDSHRCDVAGARAAGMDAILLDGEAATTTDLDPAPVAIFPDLCAFAAACVHSRPV